MDANNGTKEDDKKTDRSDELEEKRIECDLRRLEIDSIDRVLSVVKYLDDQYHGRVTKIEEFASTCTITVEGRPLTPREDEIHNDCHEFLRRSIARMAFAKRSSDGNH